MGEVITNFVHYRLAQMYADILSAKNKTEADSWLAKKLNYSRSALKEIEPYLRKELEARHLL